ncbi:MAG: putative PEP-binding protein [Oscillospiraceae bacterium]
MTVFNGKSVCEAVASGHISILKKPSLSAERIHIDDTGAEKRRVDTARYIAAGQLQEIYDRALEEIGESNAQIFGIHMMMLEDEDYTGSINSIIEAESVNAEYAVARTSDIFAQMLEAMDNEYMRARSADVRDVSNRMIAILSGREMNFGDIRENSVICTDDLTPSEAASLYRSNAAAFVTAHGSPMSHTAILAHSMNIPAIIGAGDDFLSKIHDGEEAIVDGYTGEVILSPDKSALQRVVAKQRSKSAATAAGNAETRTLDGKRVTLLVRTDDPTADLPVHADGICAMDCPVFPDEQQQTAFYRRIAEFTANGKAIIRLPDIPLTDPDRYPRYGSQMRSVFRACAVGNPGVLFPAITSVQEAQTILGACDGVKSVLRERGFPVSESAKIGFMLETPAAAIISDSLAPIADFFIIDSDRLARSTLASSSDEIFFDEFADSQKESVLRLIEFSARNAVKNGAKIGIFGSLAEDPSLTEQFLRMGIDKFCVSPGKLSAVRREVISTDLSD